MLVVTVDQGNQILTSMQTTMSSLQDYKAELQIQLEKNSNPQERAELQNQINQADNNIKQIASLGKDYQYALYEKTNDFKYLAAFAQLSTATSGNELADAFMAGMAATGGGTKKSPTTESTPPPRSPGEIPLPRPVVSKNADGFTELSIPVTPREAQARLNTVDASGNGKLSPAEAAAAAQTESIFGPMKRYEAPSSAGADMGGSNPSPDFVVTGGSNAGKTVDFMYTTSKLSAKEVEMLNKFYAKNMESGTGKQQVQDHINKADIVPVDFRVLTPANQKIFMDYVKTLPAAQQSKIVILR